MRVFAFTFGLSALTALVVGLISGLQGSKPGVMRAMQGGRVTDRRFAPGVNVRSAVIALQMALSMILLIPCGLMVRSWLKASTIAPGFSTEHVLLLPISTDQSGVRVQKPAGFDRQLLERVAALPGVEAATVMDPVPLVVRRQLRPLHDRERPGISRRGAHRVFGDRSKVLRHPADPLVARA